MTIPNRSFPARRGLLRNRSAGLLLATALAGVAITGCGDGVAPAAGGPTTSAGTAPPAIASPASSPIPSADRDGDGLPDLSDLYPDDPKNIPQQAPVN